MKKIYTLLLLCIAVWVQSSGQCTHAGPITGSVSVCAGDTIHLADTASGGVWGSSNHGVATVNGSGVVTGVAAGTDSIVYGCGASLAVQVITVKALPTVTINPGSVTTFCAGDSVRLTAVGSGGGSGAAVLDQSQLVYNGGTSARNLPGYSEWQSFTAGMTGTLTQIDIGFFNAISGVGTLNIFSGTGTGGTLLQTQTVNVVCSGGNCTLPFIVSAAVTAGLVYTFQFIPGAGIPDPYGVQVEVPGTYVGGQMDLVDPSGTYNTGFDMVFETFVSGPGGLHYLWSTGATDTVIEAHLQGSYTVTVSDPATGCSASDSLPVMVNPLPVINAVSNQAVCAGTSVTAINFSGGAAGTVYNWTNSDTAIGLAASGTGSIASFTAVNRGAVPITATITATPVSSGTGDAYIANAYSNDVSVINTATNTVVATINNINEPYGVAASPDGTRVYVTNSNPGDNTIEVINTATNTVIDTITVGYQPDGIVVSPDGRTVYVANTTSNTVSVVNVASHSTIATIPVGGGPLGIAINPNGREVFTPNSGSHSVSVISTATNTVIATITGLSTGGESGVAVSPNGSYAYVADNTGSAVSVISTANDSVIATITVGMDPAGIAVTPNGNYVYVANENTGTVSVISTSINTVIATITVGTSPLGVSISADGSKVYVANENSGNVSVINTATNTVVNTITVGGGPFSMGNFLSGTGCPGLPITFTITVNPIPVPGITGTATACVADSLTATGGTSYSWSGGSSPNTAANVFTTSGNYTVTVTGNTCTATASQTVTVNQPGASQFSQSICAGQSYTFHGQSLTQGGAYGDTLLTMHGCDSIVTLHLTVNNIAQTAITDTACRGIAYMFNGRSLYQSGIYRDTLPAVTGCDSVVTLSLMVDSAAAPTISQSGNTLQTQPSATYQWLLNGSVMSGATTRIITITQNGNYTVIVTNANGCSDTSAAWSVTKLSIDDLTSGYGVRLYPNPNSGDFALEFTDDAVRGVEITDAAGRAVTAPLTVERQQEFDLGPLPSGVYFLRITQDGAVRVLKFSVVR